MIPISIRGHLEDDVAASGPFSTAPFPTIREMSDAAPPYSLTPAEWLTLFPSRADPVLVAGTRLPYSLLASTSDSDVEGGNTSLGDPAAGIREQFPVTLNVLYATLRELGARGIAHQTRILTVFFPLSFSLGYLISWLVVAISLFVINCLLWKLNSDGYFGSTQLIAGMVAMTLVQLALFAINILTVTNLGRRQRPGLMDRGTMVVLPLVQLVRWQQLQTGVLDSLPPVNGTKEATDKDSVKLPLQEETKLLPSRLLEHIPSDRFCPCKKCNRNLPRAICWERWFRGLLIIGYSIFFMLVQVWSPVIHYSAVFWAEWHSITLGVVFFASTVLYIWIALLDKWYYPGIPSIKSTTKLYHRASSLALQSFLERARTDLRSPPTVASNEPGRGPELFVKLHASYMNIWAGNHIGNQNFFAALVATILPGFSAVATIINLVGSQSSNIIVSDVFSLFSRLRDRASLLILFAGSFSPFSSAPFSWLVCRLPTNR